MLEKAQGKLNYDFEKEKLVIDPRVAFQIVEHSSIISNGALQEMWAGLFASSCNTYEEDENIFFIDILKRLTSSQVKLLNYLCENCNKTITINSLPVHIEEGNIHTSGLQLSYDDVLEIMGTKNKLKADSELNALESMSLIEFQGHVQANITTSQKIKPIHGAPRLKPSISTLLLYVKCQGSNDTPFNYFHSKIIHYYHSRYDAYFSFTETRVLEKLYELSQIGKLHESDLKYINNGIQITNPTWGGLTDDELGLRLKHYIVFKFLGSIDKTFPISIGAKHIGTFSYSEGFRR